MNYAVKNRSTDRYLYFYTAEEVSVFMWGKMHEEFDFFKLKQTIENDRELKLKYRKILTTQVEQDKFRRELEHS